MELDVQFFSIGRDVLPSLLHPGTWDKGCSRIRQFSILGARARTPIYL